MKLLPILTAEPLSANDRALLGEAKRASGYSDPVKPARAVQGSPGRVLAIGVKPTWLCEHAYVPSITHPGLRVAMKWALGEEYDARATTYEMQLSEWMGCDVKQIGEERSGPTFD